MDLTNQLSYCLFHGTFHQSPIFTATKELWKKVWVEEMIKIDPDSLVNESDFDRQDYVGAILYKSKPVALHLYSLWNVTNTHSLSHPYFDQFPESLRSELVSSPLESLISFEYLAVDNDYRKRKIGLSLAEVIIQCGTYLTKREGIDAAIAPARSDYQVNTYSYRLGFVKHGESYQCHNVTVDTIVGYRERLHEHKDAKVTEMARRIWREKKEIFGDLAKDVA